MIVDEECSSALVESFDKKAYSLDVLKEGTKLNTLITSGELYATKSEKECLQSYEVVMDDGSATPDSITIDASTG